MSSVQALFPRFSWMDLEMELAQLDTQLEKELETELEMVGFHLEIQCPNS